MARTAFINDKVIEKVADEDFDEQVETEVVDEVVTDAATRGIFSCFNTGKSKQRKIKENCPYVSVQEYPHGVNPVDFPSAVFGAPAKTESGVPASYNAPAPAAVNFMPPPPPSDA